MASRDTGGGNLEENPANRRARLCRDHHLPDGHGRRVLCGPRRHDKEVHGGETKPTTTTTTVVDNGIFKTKTEAETGMKTMKVCTEH